MGAHSPFLVEFTEDIQIPNLYSSYRSEEQIKVFALPRISPKRKFKMTAVDGSLLRKVIFSKYPSSSNQEYHEYGMGLLTNLGKF